MKNWFNIIGTIIIFVLLVYILKGINFHDVYILLTKVKLFWFVLAVLSAGLVFFSSVFNLKFIFRDILKFDFFYFTEVVLIGAFFNTVTPSAGMGGEPFKARYLSLKYKKPDNEVFAGVLLESFFRLMVFFFFVLISIFFVLLFVKISYALKIILEILLGFVLVMLFIIFWVIMKKSHSKWKFFFRKFYWFGFIRKRFKTEKEFMKYLKSKIGPSYHSFRKIVRKKENYFLGFLFAFGYWFANFFTAYFLFLSFGHNFNFFLIIIVFILSQIIGGLSPIPGGMGVVEGARILLYSAVGVNPSLALLVAVLQRVISYFYSLFLGGISLAHLKISEV